jgi:glyceraldehyde 3-phosphate dehydrogenase
MKKIGINGFGRIGRYFTRMALQQNEIQIVAINDLTDPSTLAHLLKYDSIHGVLPYDVKVEGSAILVNGQKIEITAFKDPAEIPWQKWGVEAVLESTGLFKTRTLAAKHFNGGAKKVFLSAPPEDKTIKTVVLGVNDSEINQSDTLISNASCTTNSAAPLFSVMRELCNIKSAYITTVHSYTSDQRLHDAPHKDLRRARAAAESIVPTTTGAAKAITAIFPELEGHIGGCGIRVPVPDGSLTDLTLVVDSLPSVSEVNQAFKRAAEGKLKGILSYIEDPIVSRDIVGNPYSCIFDSLLTSTIGDNMIKIVAWYDNEAGYSNRLLDLMRKFA